MDALLSSLMCAHIMAIYILMTLKRGTFQYKGLFHLKINAGSAKI